MDLFCYGSLEFAEVMQAVTGRTFAAEPAWLPDFARYRVRDGEYPGLVREPGARTAGTLFRGLDAASREALDRFEGALYERQVRQVELRDGRREAADVYVVVAARRAELTREPWDKARFGRDHLETFLRRIRVD